MKHIHLTDTITHHYETEIFMNQNFELPNTLLVEAKHSIHPGTRYVALNYEKEPEQFLNEQLMIEAARAVSDYSAGIVVDALFTNNFHAINHNFVGQLSKLLGTDKHLIIGPRFSLVPTYLQSKIIDEFIQYDVSGVMFDLRGVSLDDNSRLQPLAKLLLHVKKRTEIIPLVDTVSDANALGKVFPVNMIAVGVSGDE